jgi:HSP20 family molecular chaperone IbpA
MAAMRAVGTGHPPPSHATVREETHEYVIKLDVSDFTKDELSVLALGPRVSVTGDQQRAAVDVGKPFRLHERLEESFRLPDDADAQRIEVFYKHRTLELHVPRTKLEPRRLPIQQPHYLVNPEAEGC